MPKRKAKGPPRQSPPEFRPWRLGCFHETFLDAASEPDSPWGRHNLGAFLTLRLADRVREEEEPTHPRAMQYQIRATEEYLVDLWPKTPDVALMVDIVRGCAVAFETGAKEAVWTPLMAFADWLDDHGWAERTDDVLDTALALRGAEDSEVARVLLRLARRTADRLGWPAAARRLGAAHDIIQRRQPPTRTRRRRRPRASRDGAHQPDPETVLRRIVTVLGESSDPEVGALAHSCLGDLLTAGARHREALREYAAAHRASASPRQRADSLLRLAQGFRAVGRTDAARRGFSELLDANPAPVVHLQALAAALELSVGCGDRVSCERLRRLIPGPQELLAAPVWEAFQRRVADALGPVRRAPASRRPAKRPPPPGAARR